MPRRAPAPLDSEVVEPELRRGWTLPEKNTFIQFPDFVSPSRFGALVPGSRTTPAHMAPGMPFSPAGMPFSPAPAHGMPFTGFSPPVRHSPLFGGAPVSPGFVRTPSTYSGSPLAGVLSPLGLFRAQSDPFGWPAGCAPLASSPPSFNVQGPSPYLLTGGYPVATDACGIALSPLAQAAPWAPARPFDIRDAPGAHQVAHALESRGPQAGVSLLPAPNVPALRPVAKRSIRARAVPSMPKGPLKFSYSVPAGSNGPPQAQPERKPRGTAAAPRGRGTIRT